MSVTKIFMIFLDTKNNLEVITRELSLETNFNGKEITKEEDLFDFAALVKFPSHGIILRKSKTDNNHIINSISNVD